MEIEEIKKILPHRPPFLFVDKVINYTDKKIEAVKNITINEAYFDGHFPNFPLLPGVIMVEAMAQVGGILIAKLLGQEFNVPDTLPLFLGVDKVRFRRMVRPGDQLYIICEIVSLKGKVAKLQGKVLVGEELACEAELLIGFK